jgi:hypothetical protein
VSEDPRERLRSVTARLDEISATLATEETDDSTAVELAREAAQLAGEVGGLAAEAARAAAERGEPS